MIERASASKFVLFFVIFIFISGSGKAPPNYPPSRSTRDARYFSKRVPKISTAGRSARFTACTIRTSYWEFVSLFLLPVFSSKRYTLHPLGAQFLTFLTSDGLMSSYTLTII